MGEARRPGLLALEGGTPVRATALPYGKQAIDDADVEAVVQVLRGDWLTQGPAIGEFEEVLASRCGARHAVVFCNGTMALHAACFAAGLGPGDELVTSTLSFLASANCGAHVGATPRLCDIDPATLSMSAETLEPHLTDRTRVVVPIDFGGHPAPLAEIRTLLDERQCPGGDGGDRVVVIEDACHALGATRRGRPVGSCVDADMAVFSFHPVKHVTSAEGGAVLTNDDAFHHRLQVFRNHGMVKDPELLQDPDAGGWYYEMQHLGHNGRLTDLQATLGCSQMRKLDGFLERRREIARQYRAAFAEIPELRLGPPDRPEEGTVGAYHLFPIIFRPGTCSVSKKTLFDAFRAENVLVQVHYIPIHMQPYYRRHFGYAPGDFPAAEEYYEGTFSLPLFPSMDDADVADVVVAVEKVVHRYCR